MHSQLALNDRLAIYELLSKAAYALDERELDMLAASFSERARFTMRIGGGDLIGPFEGREGIMKLMTDSMAQQSDKRRHVISNEFVAGFDGKRVEVISNLTLMSTEGGEISLLSAGVYRDEVIRSETGWQLDSRHLELDKSY